MDVIIKRIGGEAEHEKNFSGETEDMKLIVGGWLEMVRLPQGIVMWVNEDGRHLDLPLNLFTLKEEGTDVTLINEIYGDVLFTGLDENGETIGLNPVQMNWLWERFSQGGHCIHPNVEKPYRLGLLTVQKAF
jgi:Domain of unknown function (DUF3846)